MTFFSLTLFWGCFISLCLNTISYTATTFITDDKGKRISAIVPIKTYAQLLHEAEDMEDIKAYDKAMRRKQEFIPLEEALKEIKTIRKNKK